MCVCVDVTRNLNQMHIWLRVLTKKIIKKMFVPFDFMVDHQCLQERTLNSQKMMMMIFDNQFSVANLHNQMRLPEYICENNVHPQEQIEGNLREKVCIRMLAEGKIFEECNSTERKD